MKGLATLFLSGVLASSPLWAAPADRIVAVVDGQAITQLELQSRIQTLQLPNTPQTRAQVLQSLIDDTLLNAYADLYGIRIDPSQVHAAIERIAAQNGLSPDGLRQAVQQHGMQWDTYVNNLIQQMRVDRVHQQVVQQRVRISEQDVDTFLRQYPKGIPDDYKAVVVPQFEKREIVTPVFEPKAVAFQHLFIRVADNASAEQQVKARELAQSLLKRLRKGESFEALAKAFSNGPEAEQGGVLPLRLNEDWPALFMQATQNVPDGQLSQVFQAPNGFHILKVLERRGIVKQERRTVNVRLPDNPDQVLTPAERIAREAKQHAVPEFHVRHILIAKSPVVSSAKAKQRIQAIQRHLQAGESFSDLAMSLSQDNSAPVGGDIGWLALGQADANFEAAVQRLPIGKVSEPVESAFGWHLIEVLAHRQQDRLPDVRRDVARDYLFRAQANHVIQDWLLGLRAQAHIDNRLERR